MLWTRCEIWQQRAVILEILHCLIGDTLPHTICAFTFSHFLICTWIKQSSSACKSEWLFTFFLIERRFTVILEWILRILYYGSRSKSYRKSANPNSEVPSSSTATDNMSNSVTESSTCNYNAGNIEKQKTCLRKNNPDYLK